jgi:hypothetical protein
VRLRNWPRQAVPVEHVSDAKKVTAEVPLMLEQARAFFAVEGTSALRELLRDGDSPASQRLKARARAQGISGGRLWKAATVARSRCSA